MYFPLEKGLYEVAPGLKPWGTDLGNGVLDQCVFQFEPTDGATGIYLENKRVARAEHRSKYFAAHDFPRDLDQAVSAWMRARLTQEHPQRTFDGQDFESLCMEVCEDVAIMRRRPDGSNFLSAISLHSPNHWAASEKIGRDFTAIHDPVAGIQKINATAPQIVDAMIKRGPYVRFAWGVATDTRLNHHPEVPAGVDPALWAGRSFDAKGGTRAQLKYPEAMADSNSPLFLRVERQVLWGFPEQEAFVFTIRTSFWDCATLKQDPNRTRALISAIHSMTPESLVYKGLAQSKPEVLDWLSKAQ